MSRSTVSKFVYVILILLMALNMTIVVQAADEVPPDILQVAQDGLARFLNTIPPEELARMGLTSTQDIRSAVLGDGYHQFTLTPDALAAYQPGEALDSILTPTDTWVFLVTVDGQARTMLTVTKVNGRWEAAEIGGLFLPAALQKGEGSLAATLLETGIQSEVATTRYVRIFQAYADFLYVQTKDHAEYLLPLFPDPARLSLQPDKPAVPEQVLPQLNTYVKQMLNTEGGMTGEVESGEAATSSQSAAEASTQRQAASTLPLLLALAAGLVLIGVGSFTLVRRARQKAI